MGGYISQDPIRLAGNNHNFFGYVCNSNKEIDSYGLSFTSWLDSGSIDYADVQAFATDKGLQNVFNPDPTRFPEGGFKYTYSDGRYNYSFHGHGTDPNAVVNFPGSHSASSPTVSITRKPINGGRQENLMVDGTWSRRRSNQSFDDSHIPLKNSPYH